MQIPRVILGSCVHTGSQTLGKLGLRRQFRNLKSIQDHSYFLIGQVKSSALRDLSTLMKTLAIKVFSAHRHPSEPIREVWNHDEAFAAASRLSMMRIMAKRTNAATVVA